MVNPVHTVPLATSDEDEQIDLSLIEGWDELSVDQQRYLVEFSKCKLKKKRAALAIGISTSKVTDWEKTDGNFCRIYNDIIDIHTEGVEEVDYIAAFDPDNNTSRGRFLKNRSPIYKDESKKQLPQGPIIQNNTTNILNVLNADETTSKGLAGVQQAYQKLKEQGKLPGK